jgi:hypothetical protein
MIYVYRQANSHSGDSDDPHSILEFCQSKRNLSWQSGLVVIEAGGNPQLSSFRLLWQAEDSCQNFEKCAKDGTGLLTP